ncbi:hypothetical protein JG687_00001345 [Phytophthora cactorum]|uniref:Rho-GAP domain-containing protein n=1 Tax=Phytophthora cactorum TaxID=29920 RepID=A0A8T1UXJ8_9STRA|nr:hypothetical protein JG687_00001345 [Phytophthora cactorum]
MADSRRVFVQLASVQDSQVEVGAPVMAFVMPTDSWLSVVNEFLMSCNDDDVEVEQRPPGLLEGCVVLHATSLQQISDPAGCEDSKQYILCTSADDAVRLQKQRFGDSTASSVTGASDTDALARGSIALTDQLESLEELDYYFDDAGTLRHCRTNQAVYELMSDERRAGELDDIVKAAIFHIQMEMLAELAFKQARVPLDPLPNEPKEARSSIFLTSDWRTNSNLLVVVNGGRGAQPGIWSRDLLIQEGLELGSMLPVMRRATACNFGVAVVNPSTNNVTIGNDTFPIRGSSSPDEHMLYVWDNIISRAQARNVYVLAYSFGAKSVVTLIQKREEQVVKRVNALVFAEGAYRIDPSTTSPAVAQFLKQRAINFKGDAQISVASGPSTDGKAPPTAAPSSALSKRSSSNKARTISLSLETTFTYFVAARDRGCGAAQFISESEAKTRTPTNTSSPPLLTMLNIQLPEHATVKTDSGSPSSPSHTPEADGDQDFAAFLEIGSPYGFKHDVHIHYNFQEARFEGIPDNFADYLVFGASERGRADTICSVDTSVSQDLKAGRRSKRTRTSSAPPGSMSLSSMIASMDPISSNDPVRIMNQHFKLPFRQVPRISVPGYEERIPAVLVMLQQHFVAKRGYLTPHIFRESPSKAERDQAMLDINCGAFRGAKHDVRVLADLIKLWFRELPEPILHEIPAGEMERLASVENVNVEVLSLLGDLEHSIILWLADLLAYVAEYQPHNHMGVDQLAIVIAPNLVRLETENPMVAVALSKAVVDLFRGVLRARFQRRQELKASRVIEDED